MAVPSHTSTVGGVLERSARRLPDKLALTFADRHWTYAELDRAVGRVAARLLELGFAKGDRVAAFGKNSDAYLLLYLGCARAGLIHVPVNFNARGDELVYLLTQSQPMVAFCDASLTPVVDEVSRPARRPGRHLAARRGLLGWALDDGGPVHQESGVSDGDLVQLLYTSGTTSQAKGAMLTHRALVHEYVSAVVALEISERDVPLHSLPLYHSARCTPS